MDIELLKATIEQQERASLGNINGDLAQSRADSLSAYLSEPYGNEQDGRSQVVTSDVADVIEGILPGLIRVFTSGDEIADFQPFGSEDEEQAKQETDTVNYYLTQSNNFVPFLQTWLRDGLISKVGYAKAIWVDNDYLEQETYQNLDDNELAYILSNEELQVVEQEQDEYTGMWTVKLKKTVKRGKPMLFNCKPETILVNNDHTEVSLRDAKFVQHRTKMTISEVRELGYKVDDDIGDDYEADSYEDEIRQRWEDEDWNESVNDPASRVVTYKENWIRIDFDGDGYTELRKVCMIGSTVLANEEADSIPVCAWTPVILPHKHVGRSLSEQVEDIQLTKTTILRQALDNLYLSNNGRWAISDRVNLDDMLVSRPGGVVRLTDGAMPGEGHIVPLVPPALAGQAFPALEYMDSVRETRTGITRYNQGMDANSLNKTATGINAIMSAAQARIELIARTFAETGLRDLMLLMHELIRKHSDKETVVKLRNEWVPVDPRTWQNRYDMRISVGLGTGNREQQMANLMAVGNVQREAFQVGIVKPENVYNLATKMAEIAGFKSPEMFFSQPQQMQPQIPPQLQEQIQQGMEQLQKLQQENQQLQAKINSMQSDASVDVYKVDKQAEVELLKMQMQNESKEMIASMQAITDAIMQSQKELANKVNEFEVATMSKQDNELSDVKVVTNDGKIVEFSQVMSAIIGLQNQIAGMQPVGIKQIRDESGRLVGGVRILADGTEQEISIQ